MEFPPTGTGYWTSWILGGGVDRGAGQVGPIPGRFGRTDGVRPAAGAAPSETMTTSSRPVRVDVVLFDGCDDLDVFGPLEALGIARKRGAQLEISTVTLTAQEFVVTNHGVRIVPGGEYRSGADYLVVPGGGAGGSSGVGAQLSSGDWYEPLVTAMESGTTLVAVCTGALLLAGAGVLGTRPVSTHHASMERLRGMGANVVAERVVDAGDVISAGGITSGIDLGLWLVERIAGREAADRAAEVLEYERFRPAGTFEPVSPTTADEQKSEGDHSA